MSKSTIELTKGEWAIIRAVWELQPCTAPDVQENLAGSKGWASSTVRTLMERMVAKGLLASEKIRHLTLYRATITQEQAQKGELLYALKNAFNDALTPMLQCMLEARDLTLSELQELEKLLRDKRKQVKK